MASEEYVKRSIITGKGYDELPSRIKNILSPWEWKARVKDHCIQKGLGWGDSLAGSTCSEQEYYEDLMRVYKTWMRAAITRKFANRQAIPKDLQLTCAQEQCWRKLFPYHLADYVTRVLRVTPFKYYIDLLFLALKEEISYNDIPNFTAADALRVVGIGRNEYIRTLNACKAKRLLWRVNKGIAREMLPADPQDVRIEPWWTVSVVNIADAEYRELTPEELANLKTANLPEVAVRARDLDLAAVRSLYRRGLIYLEVPINADDCFAILPLEGFVSNKTSDAGDARVDPVENLLYAVFVASSERLRAVDLASILNVDYRSLQAALSLACRLGFATKLAEPEGTGGVRASGASMRLAGTPGQGTPGRVFTILDDPEEGELGAGGEGAGELGAQGQAVAVVVDAEATGMLMMGALSPGLKRHSVTLFEGGRVTGDDVIAEMVSELWVSYAAAQSFEGDMAKLTDFSAALASMLEVVREAAAGRPIELLRKESLAAACKVLFHAYCAVVPITQLQHPQLPLTPLRPGPTYFGPTAQAASPWLQLALYSTARSGPLSLVFLCGQRVWRLPDQLERCTHCLLWPWDTDGEATGKLKGQSSSDGDRTVMLVEATFLLYSLNELLTHTAVMVQPFTADALPSSSPPSTGGGASSGGGARYGSSGNSAELPSASGGNGAGLVVVDVPLPLEALLLGGEEEVLRGIEPCSSQPHDVTLAPAIRQALRDMGLSHSLGVLRMVQMQRGGQACAGGRSTSDGHATASGRAAGNDGGCSLPWIPLSLQLGMPLYCLRLCKMVCQRAREAAFLSTDGRAAQSAGQLTLQQMLLALIAQYASVPRVTGSHDVFNRTQNAGAGPAFDAVAVEVGLQVQLPAFNILFDGTNLQAIDLSDCLQGCGMLCTEW